MLVAEFTSFVITIGYVRYIFFFFFQAEDGIRDLIVTGVQTCALPISLRRSASLFSCGPAKGDEIPLEGRHSVALTGEIRGERQARPSAPLERRPETPPGRLVAESADRLEVSRNRSLVFHRAALDDEPRIAAGLLEPQVQQGPGGECRQRCDAAAEHRLVVVDVGCKRRGQLHPLDCRALYPNPHCG